MEAVQLNIFCLMQDNGWMVLQQCICGTQSWIYCTRKLEVTSNLYIKRKYPIFMIHVLQHANGIVHLRASQQLEGTRTKGPCADERWTQLTLLVNVKTLSTFYSKHSLAVFFVCESFMKRKKQTCREIFRYIGWCVANTSSLLGTDCEEKFTTRMLTWTITQHVHQITKLDATLSVVSARSSKFRHDGDWCSIKLREA